MPVFFIGGNNELVTEALLAVASYKRSKRLESEKKFESCHT